MHISVNHSGAIINTGGWVKGTGYETLKHAAGSFEGLIFMPPFEEERAYCFVHVVQSVCLPVHL